MKYWFVQQALVLRRKIRTKYYTWLFAKVGKHTSFPGRVRYYRPDLVFIGEHCSINDGVFFNILEAAVVIGNNVTVSSDVFFTTATLDIDIYPDQKKHISKKIIIEDRVWLGARAVILPGVRIGQGSVVGAGAVVTQDIPPYSVYGGVPAKLIRSLQKND